MTNFLAEEEKKQFISMLADLRNGLQQATESIDKFLNSFVEKEEQKTWNPANIKWTRKESPKGPYEIAENQENVDFALLVKELEEHGGFMQKHGRKYWFYLDRKDTVCRR